VIRAEEVLLKLRIASDAAAFQALVTALRGKVQIVSDNNLRSIRWVTMQASWSIPPRHDCEWMIPLLAAHLQVPFMYARAQGAPDHATRSTVVIARLSTPKPVASGFSDLTLLSARPGPQDEAPSITRFANGKCVSVPDPANGGVGVQVGPFKGRHRSSQKVEVLPLQRDGTHIIVPLLCERTSRKGTVPIDDTLIRVHCTWNGCRTAEVRLGDLQQLHWFQPQGAPRPILHGSIQCTSIVTGDIPHGCNLDAVHRLLVCVLKRHALPLPYSELARRADARTSDLLTRGYRLQRATL
jgi:hypothetical protein